MVVTHLRIPRETFRERDLKGILESANIITVFSGNNGCVVFRDSRSECDQEVSGLEKERAFVRIGIEEKESKRHR